MVITISRMYGSGALAIAQIAGARLGYAVIHEELPTVVAARMGTSAEVVAARESEPPLVERILRGLGAGTPDMQHPAAGSQINFDQELRRETEAAVREYAAQGNVIIMGRAANMILGRGPGRLCVFVQARREWRIHHLTEHFGMSDKEAGADIDRIDAARRAFALDNYKLRWGDALAYDLILDSSTYGVDGSADVLIAALHAAHAAHAAS